MLNISQFKKKTPANKTEQVVQFRHKDAQRIASAVHAYETARRGKNPSVLPRAVGGGSEITLGVFTGAWSIGQEKEVRVQADTNVTTSVVNHFHPNIGFTASGRTCAFSGGILVLVRC